MSTTLSAAGDTLQVGGELDFAGAERALKQGSQWLRDEAPAQCRLDLAGVTRSNSAGVALMLGWRRSALEAGKVLAFDNVPEALRSLLHLAGLDELLGEPAVESVRTDTSQVASND